MESREKHYKHELKTRYLHAWFPLLTVGQPLGISRPLLFDNFRQMSFYWEVGGTLMLGTRRNATSRVSAESRLSSAAPLLLEFPATSITPDMTGNSGVSLIE